MVIISQIVFNRIDSNSFDYSNNFKIIKLNQFFK